MYEEEKKTENRLLLSLPSVGEKDYHHRLGFTICQYVAHCYGIYDIWCNESFLRERLMCPFWEATQNAARHGNNGDLDKDVKVTVWVSKKGTLLRFQDEGNFYSSKETKERIEARENFEPTHEKSCGVGLQAVIYLIPDEIAVDTDENALYMLFNKETLIN